MKLRDGPEEGQPVPGARGKAAAAKCGGIAIGGRTRPYDSLFGRKPGIEVLEGQADLVGARCLQVKMRKSAENLTLG
jgi:hypothetical protein